MYTLDELSGIVDDLKVREQELWRRLESEKKSVKFLVQDNEDITNENRRLLSIIEEFANIAKCKVLCDYEDYINRKK